MRRIIRLAVESLEGKALLSGVAPSGLAFDLTASPRITSAGTQVVFTFTETNVSNHDMTMISGPGSENFIVSQNGKPVWESEPGPQPQNLTIDTLKPNQSLTLHATWDGRSNLINPDWTQEGPPLSGTFTVDLYQNQGGHAMPFSIMKPTHVTPPRPPAHQFH